MGKVRQDLEVSAARAAATGLERRLWQHLRKALHEHLPGCHACRVENALEPGTPDVDACWHGVEVWFELKALAVWSGSASSVPGPRLVRPAQRVWWEKHAQAGGQVRVLLWVARSDELLLFDGEWAAAWLGRTSRAVLVDNTLWHGYRQQLSRAALTSWFKRIRK